MNKKIIILIIFILILVISGFYLISNKTGEGELEDSSSQNRGIFGDFFPFGNSSSVDETRDPSPSNNNGTGSLTSVDSEGLALSQI